MNRYKILHQNQIKVKLNNIHIKMRRINMILEKK